MNESAQVTMHLPANTRFVATARVVTASLAAEFDFSIDDIEDLRMGVNELVSIVIEWAEDHAEPLIALEWAGSATSLEVKVGVEGATAEPSDEEPDFLTTQILAGVVDEHEIGAGWGRVVKHRHDG